MGLYRWRGGDGARAVVSWRGQGSCWLRSYRAGVAWGGFGGERGGVRGGARGYVEVRRGG